MSIVTISHEMGAGGPEIGQQVAERLGYKYVDHELISDTARRYDVMSIPTLLLLRDGHEVDRAVGAVPEAALRAWLDEKLAATDASHPAQSGATSP